MSSLKKEKNGRETIGNDSSFLQRQDFILFSSDFRRFFDCVCLASCVRETDNSFIQPTDLDAHDLSGQHC